MNSICKALVLTPLITLCTTTMAQGIAADKDQYSLFNPTPRELLRPMSADRPDFTESPHTVDAGAFQLEMSFADYGKDGIAKSWSYAQANLKIGLLNDVDLQFVFTPYALFDNGTESLGGFGDTQVRLKINLWGNDEGDTAFAFMPFIQLPTATDGLGSGRVEGGLIFPFGMSLAEGIGLGLMVETDFVYNEVDDGYDAEFIFTGALGFDVTERVGLYLEGISISSSDSEINYRGILGIGATYVLRKDLILDVGINFGLTGEVDDVNIFTGLTVRF